jgi:acetyl-CoA carboxylase biotin carboxyl carrier protein
VAERSESGEPTPERVAEMVRSLAAVMHQSNVTELDLALGALSLRLRRPEYRVLDETASELTSASPMPLLPAERPREHEHVIAAPMIGTFYAAPTPGSPPFITEGDEVVAGQTIGIIEAMKIMNEIVADRSGIVTAILVANGEPVEYGSPLARLSPRGGGRS